MHLLVTDRLACPRCGPGHGLILLARRLVERRVLEGDFGCANCRSLYPVLSGFADFRDGAGPGASGGSAPPSRPPDDPEGALRLAALLGVTGAPATLLLRGAPVRHAERLAAMLPGVEVVALDPSLRHHEEHPGVSRGQAGARLPFYDATFRGVALGPAAHGAGEHAPAAPSVTSASMASGEGSGSEGTLTEAQALLFPLDEAFRVAAPGARVVVDLPDPERNPEARRRILAHLAERAGELLLETDRTAVVTR